MDNRKLALVKCKEIKAPLIMGGLSFGNINMKNLGLLMKWWVSYANPGDHLWKRIIKSSYEMNSQLCPFSTHFLEHCEPMKGIMEYKDNMIWFNDFITNSSFV